MLAEIAAEVVGLARDIRQLGPGLCRKDTAMTTNIKQIVEAFSGHRFAEIFAHLAPSARWVMVGEDVIEGRDAVIAACHASAAEMVGVRAEFLRFVSVIDANSAAVDATGRYTDTTGQISVVSSCDVYEFADRQLTTITSYAVELDPAAV